ncbi:MAG: hypothetical protein Q8P18_26875 [Pseudomonadota bacterium]|nr:hypothetical protein [Pseudomonadota bacterium]
MEEFLNLYFKGGRYDDLEGVPFEALRHLTDLDPLIRSVARDLFLDGNPKRKRVSPGFEEAFVPAITRIEGGGSAEMAMDWSPDPAAQAAQFYYEEARDEVLDFLVSLTSEQPEVPKWISRTSLGHLAEVMGAIKDKETARWKYGRHDPVTVGELVRQRVESEAAKILEAKDEPYQLVGQLHRVDDNPHHVAIRLREGKRDQVVPIDPALKTRCVQAFEKNAETLVRLTGNSQRDKEGRTFGGATDIRIISGPPITARLEELKGLPDGWLANEEQEGASAAPTAAFLHLVEKHIWRLIELTACDRPHLFAIPDGGVEMLWKQEGTRIVARFAAKPAGIVAVRVVLSTRATERKALKTVEELAEWLPGAQGVPG